MSSWSSSGLCNLWNKKGSDCSSRGNCSRELSGNPFSQRQCQSVVQPSAVSAAKSSCWVLSPRGCYLLGARLESRLGVGGLSSFWLGSAAVCYKVLFIGPKHTTIDCDSTIINMVNSKRLFPWIAIQIL